MSSGYGSRTVVVGALDTKGAEFAYLKALVESEGVDTLTVDFGTMGEPALTPDVTGAEVAAAVGGRVEKVRRGTWRNFCVEWPSADELLVGAGAVSHHWTPQWEAELEAAYGGAVRRTGAALDEFTARHTATHPPAAGRDWLDILFDNAYQHESELADRWAEITRTGMIQDPQQDFAAILTAVTDAAQRALYDYTPTIRDTVDRPGEMGMDL